MNFTDLLRSGCKMETLETPKHSASSGRHHHTIPADLGFDARHGSFNQYQEPQHKPTGTGMC